MGFLILKANYLIGTIRSLKPKIQSICTRMVLFLNMCDIALAHLSTLPIDSSLRRSNRSLPSPVPTSPQPPPGQHTRVAEPEPGCILRQPPCHEWLIAISRFLPRPAHDSLRCSQNPGSHHAILPKVPGRKMRLKAGIVQPRSGDMAAGEFV